MLEKSSVSHIRHIQIYYREYVRIYQLKIKSGEELLNFMGMFFNTTNSLVKLRTKLAVNGSLSKTSNTLEYIAFKHNTNELELLNCFKHYKMQCNKTIVSEDCQQNVENILDLLKLRHCNCAAFSYEEIQCILTDLCT